LVDAERDWMRYDAMPQPLPVFDKARFNRYKGVIFSSAAVVLVSIAGAILRKRIQVCKFRYHWLASLFLAVMQLGICLKNLAPIRKIVDSAKQEWNKENLLQLHRVTVSRGQNTVMRDYAQNRTMTEEGASNTREKVQFEDVRPFNARKDDIKAAPTFCRVRYTIVTESDRYHSKIIKALSKQISFLTYGIINLDRKQYSEEEIVGQHDSIDYHTVQTFLDLPATSNFTPQNLEAAVQMTLIRLRNNRLTNVGLTDSEMRLYGHMVIFASICQYAATNSYDLQHLNGVPLLTRPGF